MVKKCNSGKDLEHYHIHMHDCECDKVVHNQKDELEHKIFIQGLDCANCAMKVEHAVNALSCVKEANMNFTKGILYVNYHQESNKNFELVKKTILKIEPDVEVSENKVEVKEEKLVLWPLILALGLFVISLFINNEIIKIIFTILAYGLCGFNVYRKAFLNIGNKNFMDENFLMSLASIGALLIQEYAEGFMVLLLYSIGEYLQSVVLGKSRKEIASLMDLKVDEVTKLVDGKEVIVALEDIKINDVICVKPTQRIPVDGIITEGNSSLDTSMLSGESALRDVHEGDEVLAGCINHQGLLIIKVSRLYEDSSAAKILELCEHASNKKAHVEQSITKFARIYTPIVVCVACLLAIFEPMILNISFNEAIYNALVLLVLSCPCALVLSIPLGMFAALGQASKQGILIKGGNYLEALNEVDCMVFDKTGTITKGNFKVVGHYDEELLKYAAYGECRSEHPIAKSILEAYQGDIDPSLISDYQDLAGYGISLKVDNHKVLVGNKALLSKNNILVENENNAYTKVYVAKDDKYLGCILIEDEVKKTSAESIAYFKQQGIKRIVMLSGDRQEVVAKVAKQVDIDEYYGELLPQQKLDKLEKIMHETNGKTIFVGDGMNDAPSLARSDIGITMGGVGSDAAIEVSDIILTKDELIQLVDSFKLAKKTKRILYENIIFSLGIKTLVMVLAIFSIANMWLGVFADVGVTMIALLNTLRIIKKQKM